MASLTGQLVAETYKALLKLIDNDILTASEKQITDGFGGGSNVFIDSQGFLRANKYKVTNGLATQFLKADGSLDSNAYLTSITGAQVIAALGYTPVPTTRTITINGETHNLAADNSWTVGGTAAIWGNITGTLSNQTDLQNALNAKYNNPTGTISQYIRGDGTLATFPTMPGGLPTGGSAGQILAKIDATDYNTQWIDNYATQTKNEVKLGQTLTKGTPVYVSSANGTNIIVSRASNTSEALSSKTFGLLESGGATNDIVKCVTFGLIAGLDTSMAQAGDPVWLGVNGALIFGLANKPYAPAHLVYIGVVTRVQQNNGEIFVNIQNGFELKEIHDVYIADPANNHGLFYDIADGLWKNKSIATALGYTPQAQLSGTGFVKASGTTITYDNSTYLTTTDAASTYQRLDKMVSNLLASDTEYPNSNAVIAALALKANAANPVFTGNMTISGAEPKLYFTDTDQNPDYFIGVDAGFFRVYDQTAGATRFVINSDGNISTGVGKSITAGSFIKDGGTATQFLKADGSVDSTDYATVASLANYLLSATAASTYQTLANLSTDLTASATKYPSVNAVNAGLATKQPLDADLTAIAGLTGTTGFLKKTAADTWTLDTSTYLTTGDASTTYLAITTAASTYQRLDKMVSNLLPSSTEYPNSNAVINALALKADAANPVFTGNMTISGATPRLYFVDTDQNPDYTVFIDSGYFYIYDQTAGATRFSINSSGNINTGIGKSITAGSFIKESGTASQYLMADGSVSTFSGVSGSGTTNYLPKWTSASGLGNSIVSDNGTILNVAGALNTYGGSGGIKGALYFRNTWNDTQYPTLYSTNSAEFIMIHLPHIPYLQNSTYGYAGSTYGSIIRHAGQPTTTSFWDTGILGQQNITDAYGISRNDGAPFFYIASTGNVNIGAATDAGYKLNVSGTGRFTGKLSVNPSTTSASIVSGGIQLQSYASTNNLLGFNSFFNGTASVYVDNGFANVIQVNGGGFYFRTGISGIAGNNISFTTPLTLENTGAATFLSSVTATSFSISNGNISSNGYWGTLLTTGIGSAFDFGIVKSDSTSVVGIPTGTNNFWFAGKVGVNTTGPSNPLTVVGTIEQRITTSASSTNYIRIGTYTNGSWGSYIAADSNYSGTLDTNLKFGTNVGGVYYDRLIITANGISQIKKGDGADALQIYGSGASSYWFFKSSASYGTIGSYTTGAGYLPIYVEGSNFLIGSTTDAGYKLRVGGTGFFDGSLSAYGGASGGVSINLYYKTTWGGTQYPTIYGGSTAEFFMLHLPHIPYLQTGVNGYSGSNYGALVRFAGQAAASSYWDVGVGACGVGADKFVIGRNESALFTITNSGNVTATAFFESSDNRLKTLIENNPIIDGIEKLEAKLYEKNGKIELGYFAQDAELIMPYAVTKNADGFLSLSYREIHTAKIARLEQRVAELEKQLNVV